MRRAKVWALVLAVAALVLALSWDTRIEVRLPAPGGEGELVWRCAQGGDPQARAKAAQAALWPELAILTQTAGKAMAPATGAQDPSGVKAADAALEKGLAALSRRIDREYGCRPTR